MARGFDKLQEVLATNVRDGRQAKGLSQEMLALEAEVDRTYVSQIERGVCNPSLRVLHQIAGVLRVPLCALLQIPDRPK
jgi:transcriptional regulator with XRE-family HTH domain